MPAAAHNGFSAKAPPRSNLSAYNDTRRETEGGVQPGIRQELDELHGCSSAAAFVDEHGHVDIKTKFWRKDRDRRYAGSGDDP